MVSPEIVGQDEPLPLIKGQQRIRKKTSATKKKDKKGEKYSRNKEKRKTKLKWRLTVCLAMCLEFEQFRA